MLVRNMSSGTGSASMGHLIGQLRSIVNEYMDKNEYRCALFWADKVVSLSNETPQDVYKQAQCFYHLREYQRATHLISTRNLHKGDLSFQHLLASCHFAAKEYNKALDVLINDEMGMADKTMDTESNWKTMMDEKKWKSAVSLLKGKIYESLDNRTVAADCFKEALEHDVHCYEAFYCLIQHHMLTSNEEDELISSMKLDSLDESERTMIELLYHSQLKKYAKPGVLELSGHFGNILSMNVDMLTALAERYYYNCDYQKCIHITNQILIKDIYHNQCLPIHLSCLMELNKTNNLFELAHTLVDLQPDNPISWYAVGCYYLKINKTDSARRFLSKSTSLDSVFGPAWLLYGHSFAVESEHDQAMAAYFKASHLMKGCHLPLLYIGLEYGLTDNTKLAEKFFSQALVIAPDDPFVLHELGVIAFQTKDYIGAEKHFGNALKLLQNDNDLLCIPEKWEPLYNNMGHCLRKLKKYEDALKYHKKALVLYPQNPSSYSAIGFVYSLMCKWTEAVEYFHKALGLKRDDPFSNTMLSNAIEQLLNDITPLNEDLPPYELQEDIMKANMRQNLEKTLQINNSAIDEIANNEINLENDSLQDSCADIEMEISNE